MNSATIRQALLNKRMLICIFTGFASGMPLYLLISLVPAWLRTEGVGLKEIGFFALIGLPYTWKFLWSPLLDRYQLSFFSHKFGLRRSWMFATQILLFAAIAALGFFDPSTQIWSIAWLCLAIAFLSATQDIVLDAYRRQILPDQELGLGNSIHVNAYRIAGLVPGSLSLILADTLPWQQVFFITAAFMFVGIALTISITEPRAHDRHPTTLQKAIVDPFKEFFSRQGVKQASLILAFMLLYKLGDSMATALATPFYLDLGFSMTQIGLIAKHAALWPMIFGGILGGILMLKIGINRALWLFGLVQISLFSALQFWPASVRGCGCWVWLSALNIWVSVLAPLPLWRLSHVRLTRLCRHAVSSVYSSNRCAADIASSVTGILLKRWLGELFLLCTALRSGDVIAI